MADVVESSLSEPPFKRLKSDHIINCTSTESPINDKLSTSWISSENFANIPSQEVSSSCDSLREVSSSSGYYSTHYSPHLPQEASSSDPTFGECQQQQAADSCQEDCPPTSTQQEDPDDDIHSTISDISGLGDLSDCEDFQMSPAALQHLQKQLGHQDPRQILAELVPGSESAVEQLDEATLWKFLVNMLRTPPRRERLSNVCSLDHVVGLLRTCRNIIVLTGAGVSVSCGIPDFRSHNGIYSRLQKDYPDLPDPQAMFDIHYFHRDPRPFFKFAREIYPGQFIPSLSHKFIKLLEDRGQLLRNYTQNIDTLEHEAGISRVITCHGSFKTATCLKCRQKTDCSAIKEKIFSQEIPYCTECPEGSGAIIKPDIVFFGESLSEEFHSTMGKDKSQCDLLIVVGSSLKVRPVALLPSCLPPSVPQVLINREPLPHVEFDVELLGDCDVILSHICARLGEGWDHLRLSQGKFPMAQITSLPPSQDIVQDSIAATLPDDSCLVVAPNRYVFPGAEVSHSKRRCSELAEEESGDEALSSEDESSSSSSDNPTAAPSVDGLEDGDSGYCASKCSEVS